MYVSRDSLGVWASFLLAFSQASRSLTAALVLGESRLPKGMGMDFGIFKACR